MKNLASFTALILLCLFTQPALAQGPMGGNTGNDDSLSTQRRLDRLEENLKQLQFRVQALEAGSGKSTITSCYMKLPLSEETIVATEPTETGARQKVLAICSRRVAPMHCTEDLVKCGQ